MISYRRATFSDKPNILAFYQKAYPDDYAVRSSEQWDWQYENNPFTNGKLGIWLATDEKTNEIVGHTGVIFEPISIGSEKYSVGWGIDLVVLPEYRGKRIAVSLQEKMMKDIDFYFNISMSETTRIVSAKLGAFETQEVQQWIKPLFVPPERINHYRLMKTYARNALTNKASRLLLKKQMVKKALRFLQADKLMSKQLMRKAAKQQQQKTYTYDIREITNLNDLSLVEQVWKENKNSFDKMVARNKTYLKWKYFAQPHKKHHLFIALDRSHPLGYIVLREGGKHEPNVGIIVDYLFPAENTNVFDNLIKFAVDYFTSRGNEFVYINTTVSSCLNSLTKNKFRKSRTHYPSFLTNKSRLAEYVKNNPEGWFLTFTDHELDRYPIRGK